MPATSFAQKVTTDWDHGTDFSKFKTYAYAKGTPVEDPLMDQRLVAAIEAALEKEGIKKADSDPDMYAASGHAREIHRWKTGWEEPSDDHQDHHFQRQ